MKARVESPIMWPMYFLFIEPVYYKLSLFTNAMVVGPGHLEWNANILPIEMIAFFSPQLVHT